MGGCYLSSYTRFTEMTQEQTLSACWSLSLVCTGRSTVHHMQYYLSENQIRLHCCLSFSRICQDSWPHFDTTHQFPVWYSQRATYIKWMATSEQHWLQQLFNSVELGNSKPSQLLHQMQQLLGDKASATEGSFMCELFLQCLSAIIRMVLASTNDTTGFEDLTSLTE